MRNNALTLSCVLCLPLAAAACKKEGPAAPPKEPGAAAPAEPAEPPAPPAPEGPRIKGEEVAYEAGGVTLKGYLAYDASTDEPRPGVLVVHEWWGHNDYARKRADMLAEMGYTALAVDMYGDGKTADHPKDAQKFMQEVLADKDAAMARLAAAKKLLEEHPTTAPDQTAAIGYCFGGGVVLNAARAGMDLDAVASFHGSLEAMVKAHKGDIKARILVLHGEADPFVPQKQVDAFQKEMDALGADYKLIGYPGAKHAFTNPAATEMGKKFDLPLEYNQEADKESWAELETFLAATFNRRQ